MSYYDNRLDSGLRRNDKISLTLTPHIKYDIIHGLGIAGYERQ